MRTTHHSSDFPILKTQARNPKYSYPSKGAKKSNNRRGCAFLGMKIGFRLSLTDLKNVYGIGDIG